MGKDHRIEGKPFTCQNAHFETDTSKGERHHRAEAKGSVFTTPLVSSGYTLWLEYVRDKKGGPDVFWLMWYDAEGVPTIPMSGIMSLEQVRSMTARLSDFIAIPGVK